MAASTIDVTARTTEGAQSTAERLSSDELRKIHAYWRACNYLAAGMIYLRDNPLLRDFRLPWLSRRAGKAVLSARYSQHCGADV